MLYVLPSCFKFIESSVRSLEMRWLISCAFDQFFSALVRLLELMTSQQM